MFALELLPTEYLLTNLNASGGASDDVCTQTKGLKTPALFALRDEPLWGITKLNTGLTSLLPLLFGKIHRSDRLTLRYSQTTLRAAILVSYLPRGASVGVYSGRNRPPPPQ